MVIGVLCIYGVLVLLFKDFMQPVTILAALPLSIGGLITSTLLSLLVVPVVFIYIDDLEHWLRRASGLMRRRDSAGTTAKPVSETVTGA